MIKVDKNVPLPQHKGKYPWRLMAPGDSFFIPVPPGECSRVSNSMRTQAQQQKRKFNETFIVRRVDGGVRVWRTA